MKKIAFILISSLLAFSCSSLQVATDYDKTVDFTKYKTLSFYGWAEDSNENINTFDQERIERAFAREFKNRDIEIIEKGGDIIVSLYIVTEQKTQRTANTYHYGGAGYGGYYGYGPGYGWGGGFSTTTYNEYEYTQGTLIISVFDAEKEILVWESIGKGIMEEKTRSPERAINYAAAKIMQQYPIKPVKK